MSVSTAGLTSATRSSCIGSTRKCMSAVFLIGNRCAQIGRDAPISRLALLDRHARLEPRDHAEEHVDARAGVEVDAQRGPQSRATVRRSVPGGNSSSNARREHADHLRRAAAELDRLADDDGSPPYRRCQKP